MNFSFEFDAPKYKCFGRQQPRRSTITEIDRKSVHDRWFLEKNQNVNHPKQISQKTDLNKQSEQQNSGQLNLEGFAQIVIKKSKVQQKNQRKKIPVKISKITRKVNKVKENSSTIKSQQNIKQIDKKVVKKSKSLPNIVSKKALLQKHRNPPCLYPIRVQREWEEKHGKRWYDLSSQQLTQAQQSMKKKLNKPKNIDKQEKRKNIKVTGPKKQNKQNISNVEKNNAKIVNNKREIKKTGLL